MTGKMRAIALLALIIAMGNAQADSQAQSSPAVTRFVQRVFIGNIGLAANLDSYYGTLKADNPKCILTVPNAPAAAGVGPNGSILLEGSSGCPGSYELFLSGGTAEFALPSQGGIGNNIGVYSGTFTIIHAKDQQTVVWAGTYTQVYNGNPNGTNCEGLTFCANLSPYDFGVGGLEYLLELNGFTWLTSSHN